MKNRQSKAISRVLPSEFIQSPNPECAGAVDQAHSRSVTHCLYFPKIPRLSQGSKAGKKGVRYAAGPTFVQAESKRHATEAREWDVIPRQIDALKPVVILEIHEAVP